MKNNVIFSANCYVLPDHLLLPNIFSTYILFPYTFLFFHYRLHRLNEQSLTIIQQFLIHDSFPFFLFCDLFNTSPLIIFLSYSLLHCFSSMRIWDQLTIFENLGSTFNFENLGSTFNFANLGSTFHFENLGSSLNVANLGSTFNFGNLGSTFRFENLG